MGANQQSKPIPTEKNKTKDVSMPQLNISFKSLIQKFQKKYSIFLKEQNQRMKFTDFNGLQEIIRSIFIGIVKRKMKQVNKNQITMKQSKLDISTLFMQIHIQVLKNIVNNESVDKAYLFQHNFQQFLKSLLHYLKTIYPRGQNNEAGQLAKQFTEFDQSMKFVYDPLRDKRNSNICFHSIDQLEITKSIKILLNNIMQQIDEQFPKFEQFIKNIDKDFKVGRKIPENTARYTLLDTGIIQIKSSEIARVLIKWAQDLEDMINKPEQVIKMNQFRSSISTFKLQKMNMEKRISQQNKLNCCYRPFLEQLEFSNDKNKVNKIANKNNQQLTYFQNFTKSPVQFLTENSIPSKIKQFKEKDEFLSNQRAEKKYFNEFTISLIKMFTDIKLQQYEISNQMMQVVKLSYFSSDYISWIVEQKLIKMIQLLVKAAKQSNQNDHIIDPSYFLDLVKFNVKDLMRCMIHGDRKTIKRIFQRFKRQQKQNKIQIVKIKNRFASSLSDAMIFFKMKDSFIICECQLILSGKDDENNKNIESLNHFIYELQRSKFGFLGQLSVFLRNKSETVSEYCSKISLELQNTKKTQIQNIICYYFKQLKQKPKPLQPAPESIIQNLELSPQQSFRSQQLIPQFNKIKYRPFICNYCFKFQVKYSDVKIYREFNNFMYKYNIRLCNLCFQTILIKVQLLKKYLNLREDRQDKGILQRWVQQKTNQNKREFNLNKQCNQDYQHTQSFLEQLYNYCCQMVLLKQRKKKEEIKVQELMKYLNQTQSDAIKNNWKIHFISFTELGDQIKVAIYKYDPSSGSIKNVTQPIEQYKKHQTIKLNNNSTYFHFKTAQFSRGKIVRKRITSTNQVILNKYNPFYIQQHIMKTQEMFKQKQFMVYYYKYGQWDQQEKNHKYNYMFLDIDQLNKTKNKDWIKQHFQSLSSFKNLNNILDFSNQGVTKRQLSSISKNNLGALQVIELSNNQIKDVSYVLQNCKELKKLYLNSNFLQSLSFSKELVNLKLLTVQKNHLKQIKNFNKIPNIEILHLNDNMLQNFSPQVSLNKLQILIIKFNLPLKYLRIQNISKLKQIHLDQNLFIRQHKQGQVGTFIEQKRGFFSKYQLSSLKQSILNEGVDKNQYLNKICSQQKWANIQFCKNLKVINLWVLQDKTVLIQWLYKLYQLNLLRKDVIYNLYSQNDYYKPILFKNEQKDSQQQKPGLIQIKNSKTNGKQGVKDLNYCKQEGFQFLYTIKNYQNPKYKYLFKDIYQQSKRYPGLKQLYHGDCNINMNELFKFDWKLLCQMRLWSCSIDDQKWRVFADNGNKFPNLKGIYLYSNKITTVLKIDFDSFNAFLFIQFYRDEDYSNPLNRESLQIIKKYNSNNHLNNEGKKKWILSCQEDNEKFGQQYFYFIYNILSARKLYQQTRTTTN